MGSHGSRSWQSQEYSYSFFELRIMYFLPSRLISPRVTFLISSKSVRAYFSGFRYYAMRASISLGSELYSKRKGPMPWPG